MFHAKIQKTSEDLEAVPAFTTSGIQACTFSSFLLLLLAKVVQEVFFRERGVFGWKKPELLLDKGSAQAVEEQLLQHHTLVAAESGMAHLV